MGIARRGSGAVSAVRALASQVHPVFMLPPLAASLSGALFADQFSLPLAGVHLVAVFFGLYTAHVKDGYVDFYGRGEDEDHPLSERGCGFALAGASVGFFLATVLLVVLVDVWAGLLTLPGWLIGYHHAPQLDMHPVTASVGYPTGIAFALLGGFYAQTTGLAPVVIALAVVFLLVLSGIKVIDDATDVDYDRSIGKRTVAVAVGPERARTVAYSLMVAGMLMVLVLALAVSTIPPSGAVAALAFGLVALLTRNADAKLATKLLIRGSYVFLALLLAAVWFRPLT